MNKHKPPIAALALALFVALALGAWPATAQDVDTLKYQEQAKPWDTADHSKFEILKQEFTSGPEVTKACLTCHNEAGHQFMKTIHWTWLCPKAPEEAHLGKAGWVVNNFCVGMPSNEPRCTSCHAGYGWKNKDFDFSDQNHIDCLVCHEQTGTYKKFPTGAGNPVSEPKVFKGNKKTYYPPDWNKVAQSVSRPTRRNCGTCHFFGGGGDGVKHGDLDSSMFKPNKELDVHMAADGLNFTCTRCHTTREHSIAGRCYKTPATDVHMSLLQSDWASRISCVSCHSNKPHFAGVKANDHTDKVACQTCHIPAFARKLPTKMWWDWSKAGKMNDKGKPFAKKVEIAGVKRPVYHTKKGEFVWKTNVEPEYKWWNGAIENVMLTTKIDPDEVVELTVVKGGPDDSKSRIYPFKVHRGKQPYDAENNTMLLPHLFGKDKAAYWKGYDWNAALAAGMAYVGLPYSGKYGFVETSYVFPITHQVAPRTMSLDCAQCHSREGRLAGITGVYIPGRDHASWLEYLGWGALMAALIGVLLHGLARAFTRKNGS